MATIKSPFFIRSMIVVSGVFLVLGVILLILGGAGFFIKNMDDNARTGALRLFQGACVVTLFSCRSFFKYRSLAKVQGGALPDTIVSNEIKPETINRPLPPELNQPFPRRVKTNKSFILTTVFIIVTFVGLGLYMLGIAYKISNDDAILKETGVAVEAQVTDLRTEYGKPPRVYYKVTYKFLPAPSSGNQSITQTSTKMTPKSNFDLLRVGQSVPILYDPINPNRSNLNFNDVLHTSNPYGLMPMMLWMVGLMVGAPLACIISLMLNSYYREKKLIQFGYAAPASILKTENVVGRSPSVSVTYQFIDTCGNTVQGVQKNLPTEKQRETERFRKSWEDIMTAPVVLYDPQNSSKSMLYKYGSMRCYLP